MYHQTTLARKPNTGKASKNHRITAGKIDKGGVGGKTNSCLKRTALMSKKFRELKIFVFNFLIFSFDKLSKLKNLSDFCNGKMLHSKVSKACDDFHR